MCLQCEHEEALARTARCRALFGILLWRRGGVRHGAHVAGRAWPGSGLAYDDYETRRKGSVPKERDAADEEDHDEHNRNHGNDSRRDERGSSRTRTFRAQTNRGAPAQTDRFPIVSSIG